MASCVKFIERLRNVADRVLTTVRFLLGCLYLPSAAYVEITVTTC